MSMLIIFNLFINTDNHVKKVERQNLKLVYTLYHIVVSQTTLSVLEASVYAGAHEPPMDADGLLYTSHSKQCAYQYVQQVGILF